VTAPSFALRIKQWPFLAVDLWAGKPTGFQKGAQLGKAGGNAPKRRFPVQHVGFWNRRKPTTQKHISRRLHGDTRDSGGVLVFAGEDERDLGGGSYWDGDLQQFL